MGPELCFHSISELGMLFRQQRLSPVEVINALLVVRIDDLNPQVHAYITAMGDRARLEAQAAERLVYGGNRSWAVAGHSHCVKGSVPYCRYANDFGNAQLVNFLGLCAVSVPCGFEDDLPIGLQIIGKPFDEASVLRLAFSYEQATDWHTLQPSMD